MPHATYWRRKSKCSIFSGINGEPPIVGRLHFSRLSVVFYMLRDNPGISGPTQPFRLSTSRNTTLILLSVS